MFERPQTGERALLINVSFGSVPKDYANIFDGYREFAELATAAGAEPQFITWTSRQSPEPKFLIGTGKAEELTELVREHGIELAIFSCELSPSQERNLEKVFKCRVLDRTGLILDIFAQRARSHEGKLQVELAQLRHISTRLIRGWTHLERQKGGIGMRGPGESQLETDRRLLSQRVVKLRSRLDKIMRQRAQRRASRAKNEVPTISLVGYTNAGKSSLFNTLTGAAVFAKDQLFATLDPTLRRLELPHRGAAVIADTVGFVRNLPHELVNAFHATLEESIYADLLLHVVDYSDDTYEELIFAVNQVLEEIDASETPTLMVFNKIDCTDQPPALERNSKGEPAVVFVSAAKGLGMDLLIEAVTELLAEDRTTGWIVVPWAEAALRAQLFTLDGVLEERVGENGYVLHIDLPTRHFNKYCQIEGQALQVLSRAPSNPSNESLNPPEKG